jgi:hypothetical protein
MAQLKALPLLIPPIELQKDITLFIDQLDKSKFEIQKSLKSLRPERSVDTGIFRVIIYKKEIAMKIRFTKGAKSVGNALGKGAEGVGNVIGKAAESRKDRGGGRQGRRAKICRKTQEENLKAQLKKYKPVFPETVQFAGLQSATSLRSSTMWCARISRVCKGSMGWKSQERKGGGVPSL